MPSPAHDQASPRPPLAWTHGQVLSIALASLYTITLDQYAIHMGIWKIYPGTGLRLPVHLFGNRGVQLEQFLIYSLTSVLVVFTLRSDRAHRRLV